MRIIILLAFSVSLLGACKRGRKSLEINDIKPTNIPISGGQNGNKNQEVFEWDGASDLALNGLIISSK